MYVIPLIYVVIWISCSPHALWLKLRLRVTVALSILSAYFRLQPCVFSRAIVCLPDDIDDVFISYAIKGESLPFIQLLASIDELCIEASRWGNQP